MGPRQAKTTRNRTRKRKRRIVSDPSSSSEDTSSSSDSSSNNSTPNRTVTLGEISVPTAPENTDTGDSEDDSSDESQNDSDSSVEGVDRPLPPSRLGHPEPPLQCDLPSPQPVVDIPPFISPKKPEDEQVLKERFRKFWMASIAEGFKDDLEEIRKEPNLGPSRLALLIDSLASGSDVFSSRSLGGSVNEMEVVLDQLP